MRSSSMLSTVLPPKQRVGAAGVVTDHAADGAAVVGGRIGRKRQLVEFRLPAERVEHHPGLYAGEALLWIELEDPIHVLGEVEHYGDIAALSGQAGACSAGQDRSSVFTASRHGSHDIVGIAGNHQPDGNLAIVRSVGRIHGAAPAIETDFSLNVLL